ncbi:type II toxin-antitoxin system RelE/ParE family toxin [candidate division KSB1 bacterium]|nr:type II toxin-antitoxin system RelE/ParE family toxin [candidate division KSB1 bacterium]
MSDNPAIYEVRYSNPANVDLENIITYLKKHSTRAAHNLIEQLEKTALQLTQFPRSGALSIDESLKEKGYRIIGLKYRFLLFYTIDETDKIVWIKRVLHCSRDLANILF